MSEPTVQITVNGKTISVPKGMLLVEAAKFADVNIPVFCHHPKLEPAGVCRMCLVEVEGQRKPVTACTMPVADGMVVNTESEVVQNLQRGVLEFLLLNHPLDCPVCDKGGECPLQDQTYTYGPAVSRSLDPKSHKLKAADLGNFIVLDQERCILCRRCTRFDDEITHENNLIIAERADGAVVTTAVGERFDSYFSGNTIEMCPVGALTSDLYRFKARPWDLAHVPSVCTGCAVGCNTRLDYRFGELLRLQSRENDQTDGGWLCDRGRFNYKFVQGENRLQTPLIRRNGQLEPTTWRVALTEIAKRLKQTTEQHGGTAAGIIGGAKLTNEEAYLLQKFARVGLRTNNIDYRTGRQALASNEQFSARMTDVDTCDAIVLVDIQLAERAPVLDLRVRRAGEKGGARLVSVGSRHGAYRPAVTTIPALPGAVAETMRSEALKDALDGCQNIIFIWDGVDGRVGEALTAVLAQLNENDITARLVIASGHVNSRGAERMGLHPQLLPGGRLQSEAADRKAVAAAWDIDVPGGAGLDTAGMLAGAAAGQLETLLLFGANLMQTFPDTLLVERALDKASFVVAADLFLTETAAKADIVLPAAAFPAKSGTYTALDGLLQTVTPANDAEFETWTDGQIISALADMLGSALYTDDNTFDAEMAMLGCGGTEGVAPGLGPKAVAAVLANSVTYDAVSGEGLLLVPVARLFAGGGTAAFDEEISKVRPAAAAFIHTRDAVALSLEAGDAVVVSAAGEQFHVTLEVDDNVIPGTVHVPTGLPQLPVYKLMRDGMHARVSLARRAMEEVS